LNLELRGPGFYVRRMKRISFFLAAAILATPVVLRAQDAAVEERLNKLSAQIQDLIDAKDAQKKRLDELAGQLRELQDQQGKPNAGYATQEDLKQLAAKLQEVDRKRQDDSEHVVKELENLRKTLAAPPVKKTSVPANAPAPGDGGAPPNADNGWYHVVKSGQTLEAIAKAYSSEYHIKVTSDDILKANPGLKPERISIGQKIFIPAPPR
jgi:LysM repeat protein